MHGCPRCQRDRLVTNGAAAGTPTKPGNQCGSQLTRMTSRGTSRAMQMNAVRWDLRGISMHRIACLLRVSAHAVLPWIRDLATAYDAHPEPTGRTIVLPRDAMGHSRKH